MASSPREDNRVPGLVAKSDADNTPVFIEADAVTKRIKTNTTITGGVGSSSTSVTTSVNDTASSTQLLAANSSRIEANFTNDSSSILYLKLGTTASTSDYTAKLLQDDFFNTNYKGRIDGIWSSDSTGSVRITELT